MTRHRMFVVMSSLVIAGAAGVGVVALRSTDQPATTATTTPAPRTTATPSPSSVSPAPSPLPANIPGVELVPVEIGTYRISLVFRLRNTILNGLPGAASNYTLKTVQAKQGNESGLILGVAVVPGASAPDVGRSIRGLIDVAAVATERRSGRLITIHQVPGYHLAVVNAGPRRALMVIASRRATARAIARAVAGAVSPQR